MKFRLLLLLLLLSEVIMAADSTAVVNGIAFHGANRNTRLEDLMVINLRTNQGVFGKADGSFSIRIQHGDSIVIASLGYEYRKVSFHDSVPKPVYNIEVPLVKLSVTLKEITVFSPRELDSIYKDIKKLGYSEDDYTIDGINAIESPITFLYLQYNKLEQLKRYNAERINNEKRRRLLKQLLTNYVSHDIFYLDEKEFDDFIDFANIPEEYMKRASQYDFCVFVKQRFEIYQAAKRR